MNGLVSSYHGEALTDVMHNHNPYCIHNPYCSYHGEALTLTLTLTLTLSLTLTLTLTLTLNLMKDTSPNKKKHVKFESKVLRDKHTVHDAAVKKLRDSTRPSVYLADSTSPGDAGARP